MELRSTTMENGARLVKLTGKLDGNGVREIETKLAGFCAGERVRVMLDLSGVDYLASKGIRLLILTARSVVQRHGRLVLLNPAPGVNHVLVVSGIPEIIPTYSQLESAETVLMA